MDISLRLLVAGVTGTKMSMAASFTYLLYDYVLTLEAEKAFIWDRQWSFGKTLFIFNRYFGIAALCFNMIVLFNGVVDDKFCKAFIWWEAASQVTAVTSVGIILQARIYAVYGRSRRILVAMIVLSLSAVVSALAVVFVELPDGFSLRSLGLTGCYIIVPKVLFLCWVPGLVSETILCLLMLYKAALALREDSSSDMLKIIVRDSLLYFITIFAVLLGNCLVWLLGPPTSTELILGWEIAVPCAVGSRLLINMRERAYRERASNSLHFSDASHLRSEIRFYVDTRRTRGDGQHDYILVPQTIVPPGIGGTS